MYGLHLHEASVIRNVQPAAYLSRQSEHVPAFPISHQPSHECSRCASSAVYIACIGSLQNADMTQKQKASTRAEPAKASPRKKAKTGNETADGQAKLGGFLKTPDKKGKSTTSHDPTNSIISLLSDSEPGEDAEIEQVAVASGSKRRRPPVDSEVIDLEGVLSSDTDAEDIKPVAGPSGIKKESNASLHPLFRKTGVKLENGDGSSGRIGDVKPPLEQEDTKPVIDRKGKGKAEIGNESPKKLIFPKVETDDPVSYPLEKDIFEFDPKTDISTETWPRTQAGKLHTPYSFLVAAFVLISATRSRLIIVTVLTNTLRTIVEYDPEALKDTVYLVGFPK